MTDATDWNSVVLVHLSSRLTDTEQLWSSTLEVSYRSRGARIVGSLASARRARSTRDE
jgi:hypothetical protein